MVIRVAGPRVGLYIGEKYVMRLIPVVNTGLGYWFNNTITKSVGRWAKVRAKIRSSTFRHAEKIAAEESDALVWILPTIFHVGTAADSLTEGVLTLYSQCAKRIPLTEEQKRRVADLIDSEELSDILKDQLPRLGSVVARQALYEIALTTAAASLNPTQQERECVKSIAEWLEVPNTPESLDARVQYLKR
jgi:hypothetical protein